MPLVYGQKAKGRLVVMPVKFADTGYSKPGEVYEFHLDTTSFTGQEEAVIDHLLMLEQQVPDLRVVYAEACDCGMKVKFQVIDTGPGQFSIGGILSLLPAIFVLIGIGIVAYMLWKLYNDVPILLVVGGVAVAFLALYYLTGEKFFSGIKAIRGPEGKAATQTAKLEAKQRSLEKQAELKKDSIERLRKTKDDLLTDLANVKAGVTTGGRGPAAEENRLMAEINATEAEIKAKDAEVLGIYKRLEQLAD